MKMLKRFSGKKGFSLTIPDTNESVKCANCGLDPLEDTKYKCAICADYSLCAECKNKNVHDADHPFNEIKKSQ